ncbi:hypothetical protein VTI28DRAFT_4511 [Corynascus sepedonium]
MRPVSCLLRPCALLRGFRVSHLNIDKFSIAILCITPIILLSHAELEQILQVSTHAAESSKERLPRAPTSAYISRSVTALEVAHTHTLLTAARHEAAEETPAHSRLPGL